MPNTTITGQRSALHAAFRPGVTVDSILNVDSKCAEVCTWVPIGPYRPMSQRYALKYEYLLCRYYGRHREAVS